MANFFSSLRLVNGAAVLALAGLLALVGHGVAWLGQPAALPAAPAETGSVALPPAAPAVRSVAVHPATALAVLDGDTVTLRVQLWLDQFLDTRVRLTGIDAPELAARCDVERVRAMAARSALMELVGLGPERAPVPLRLVEVGPDKFGGRVTGRLLLADGSDVAATLLARGLVRPYAGGRRQAWC
jgi:endonuclease YncB( thermonuclease family)